MSNLSNFALALMTFVNVLLTVLANANVACATPTVSPKVRLAEDLATSTAEFISISSAVEEMSNGVMAMRPSGPGGKEETVLFNVMVAFVILAIAARIAAPSATTVDARTKRGRMESCIVVAA